MEFLDIVGHCGLNKNKAMDNVQKLNNCMKTFMADSLI
jgi:hypothetical protein